MHSFLRRLSASAAFTALAMSGAAMAGNDKPLQVGPPVPMTLAVYGDAPYAASPGDTTLFDKTPAFINLVNSDTAVQLVLHVGDIHSGKQICTQAYDQSIFDLWTHFNAPMVYTPGDNEWTDCHKATEGGGAFNKVTGNIDFVSAGGGTTPGTISDNGNVSLNTAGAVCLDFACGNPLSNLELVRGMFYPNPGFSLGGQRKPLLSQAAAADPAYPTDANYVENVMWSDSRVLFVTINLPGGSNNNEDNWYLTPAQTSAQAQEVVERTGADLRWLDLAFAQADKLHSEAVLIGLQADMWDLADVPAHEAGYEAIVASIAQHTLAFGKPVLLINGDSHIYLSDNPLAMPAQNTANPANSWARHPYYNVPNFHRIVVNGGTTLPLHLEYLRLTITPGVNAPNGANAFGPFSWTRVALP
jgi:hypothetical protein